MNALASLLFSLTRSMINSIGWTVCSGAPTWRMRFVSGTPLEIYPVGTTLSFKIYLQDGDRNIMPRSAISGKSIGCPLTGAWRVPSLSPITLLRLWTVLVLLGTSSPSSSLWSMPSQFLWRTFRLPRTTCRAIRVLLTVACIGIHLTSPISVGCYIFRGRFSVSSVP